MQFPNAGDVEEVLDSLVFPRFVTVRYEPETPTLAAVAETVRERSGLSDRSWLLSLSRSPRLVQTLPPDPVKAYLSTGRLPSGEW